MNKQAGQTLIETIVAIFVLTTTLIASLGLMIYIFSTTEINKNEVIAMSLAREGVEVIRMMRDTNWLESDVKAGTWDLTNCSDINSLCWPLAWQGPTGGGLHGYDLRGGTSGKDYQLNFDINTRQWTIANGTNYNLYLQSNGTYTSNAVGNSVYARKINIRENTSAPYTNQNSNSELIVQATVGWHNKKCLWAGTDPSVAPASCKVVVEDRLTNWKDYR